MNHHEEMNTNMHHMHHVHHGASDSEMPMNMPMHGSEHVLYSNGNSNSNGNGNDNPFCDDSGGTGGGMVMYMEGFRWTLLAETSDGEQPRSCLNLYVASWTLDTRYKFCAAMALVVVLGIATEGLGRWKHEVARQQHQHQQHQHHHTRRARRNLYWKHACLQTLSILSAYLLMLVVMTYSLELFACVLLGLTIGYWLFGGETYRHGGGGTLCCGFLEPDDDGGGGGASVGNNSNNSNNSNNNNSNEGLGGESPSLSPLLTERLLPDVIDDGNYGSGGSGSSGYGTTENHGHPCCNNNNDDDDDDGGDVEVVASPNENGQEGII